MIKQTGMFIAGEPVILDGRGKFIEIVLPDHAPRPTSISAAAVILHTGSTPILDICGFFTMVVAKPKGQVMLAMAMNRHGAVRWEHKPPILIEENEKIVLTYGGLVIPPKSPFALIERYWNKFRQKPEPTTIQPDVALWWLEP